MMPVTISQDDSAYTNDVSVTGTPAFSITGNRIRFVNSESGRAIGGDPAIGAIVIQGEGTTIVNEAGGVIRSSNNASNALAIAGSDFGDRVENWGTITGRVALGGGNDEYVDRSGAIGFTTPVELGEGDDVFYLRPISNGALRPRVDGGAGIDRYVIFEVDGNVDGWVTGIEILELRTDGYIESFSGLQSVLVDFRGGDRFFNALRFFDTPDAQVQILADGTGHPSLSIYDRSSIGSLSGSAFNDSVRIGNDTLVTGAIDLGAGDDFITFSHSQFEAAIQTVFGTVLDGGAGNDIIEIQLRGGDVLDAANAVNFEKLSVAVGTTSAVALVLRNVDTVTELVVRFYNSAPVLLESSDLSAGRITFEGAGSVTIAADSRVGLVAGPPANPDSPIADDSKSFSIVNYGAILGDVSMFIADDLLDSRDGTVGGRVFGYAGNDTIMTGAGDNWIDGGAGADMLSGGDGNDVILGGTGNDRLLGGSGGDGLTGGSGNDTAYGEAGNDTLVGDAGNDYLDGGDGDDQVYGGADNDVILGGIGADFLDGGDGDDFVAGGDDNDRIYGGAGNDTIEGGTGNEVAYGGLGNDTIHGQDGNDYVDGEDGDDFITGGAGVDVLIGGLGNDRFYAGSEDDYVYAGAGADTAYGEAGDDNLNGNAGADFLDGGDGDDRLYAGTEDDVVLGGTGTDAVYGEAGNDFLHGGHGNDLLDGGADDDTLIGSLGADTLLGGLGNDFLDGGDDNDFILGGDGGDRVYAGAGDDIVEGGTGNETMYGGLGNDTLHGQDGNDYVDGEDGDDLITGGAGADVLVGGIGNDRFYGGTDNDYIAGGDGADTAYGEAGDDTLYGQDGNDYLDGGDGNDTIVGGNGSDVLLGGAGDDLVIGGAGNDSFAGGAGADLFAFLDAPGGADADTITDFASGVDKILLDDAVFAGLGLGALDPNAFFAGSAAHDADDRIIYDQATGALYFDADGNGAGAAVQFATLDGQPIVTASDFTVI